MQEVYCKAAIVNFDLSVTPFNLAIRFSLSSSFMHNTLNETEHAARQRLWNFYASVAHAQRGIR